MAPRDPKDILKEAESPTANLKQLKQLWVDYVQGGSFQKECDDVFAMACNLKGGVTDNQLDATELDFAMDQLHEQLNKIAGGKLPAIEEKAEKLLKKFDEDNNGKLDREEFRRFSRVYFSRLEWPMWRVAVKGFGIGCVAFFAVELILAPVAKVVAARTSSIDNP